MIDGDAAPNEDERRMLQWLADVHRRREQAEAEVARCAAEERYILEHLQTIRQGPSPWLHSLLQAASNRG